MKDKNLPIRIFEKRKNYDDRETEGGGNKKKASWTLAGIELENHSQMLKSQVNEIRTKYSEWDKEQYKLPMIITSTMNEKATAKSHRGKITSILEADGKENVIGLIGNRQLMSLVTTEKVLDSIETVLGDTENLAQLISSIIDIEVFQPIVIPREESIGVYKVKLVNYNNYDLNKFSRILFEKNCNDLGIPIEAKTKYTNDLIIYRVCVQSLEQLELLEDFEGLYSAEPMESYDVTLDVLEDTAQITIKEPKEDSEYPIVGVLDTGIAKNDYLGKWILEKKHTNYPDEYQNNRHGTFVSGLIAYGDELNGSHSTTLDGVKIFDATVYPDVKKEKIYPDTLVEHIREAVERNNHIKIWNLSLGTNLEAELDEFSDFGMALDNIQDENNVLIVKSAGNCSDFMCNKPKSRIAKSADSIRALVVGSLAERQEESDYAESNTPSPFTRIGPGPSSIIKPDLVYFGGNAGMKDGKLIKHGVNSFDLDGKIINDSGTSFSTPRVTRIAAELNHLIKDEFDPLLIRALMIHSAKYPENSQMIMSDKINQMGFGVPDSAEAILYNSSDEITLILRDNLDKGSFIEMFDFPYPESLVDENGYFTGQITLTLVNKSLVDSKQAGEYCQSNIDVAFGTYETEKDRDITKATIKNPKGIDEGQNVLLDGLYSTKVLKEYPGTGFERECTLIKYGKKYHPVKKYAVDLANMKPSKKEEALNIKRKWYLKIEGLYRDFIEKDSMKRNYQLSQEYCMILTIKDPKGKANVYNEVAQKLTFNNFVHYDINVRNTVYVSNEE